MNTVLDDNKKLCLNSGEIIAMSPPMNMIFEVMDLAVASPATVSRCGMVYMEPHQLGVTPFLTSWLNTLPPHYPASLKERLVALFDAYAMPVLRFVRKEVREACPTPDGNIAVSFMRLWASLAAPLMGTPELQRQTEPAKMQEAADALFMFALVFSAGSTAATAESRQHIQTFMRELVACKLEEYVSPSGSSYHNADAPFVEISASALPPPVASALTAVPKDDSSMNDWMYDTNTLSWRKWIDLVDMAPIPEDASFRSIIVPTADSVAITFMLKAAVENRYPLLLVGPTGTGKTAYTASYLASLDPERYAPPNTIGFSAQTSANMAQSLIDAKLDKRRKVRASPCSSGAVHVNEL
ncbi:hypothetical protein DUNSADRAFT_5091 [Dunaliella salina]|uniref:Dynein heavy chain AAA 5 extension domain-containing protein n=1 Tax=Dunaliella salina TaxID=3046 RepID=A0ABQ7HAH6_DUNSA|nr:hypothetical protein DUNSADRAFT_5091 [Dunaliella salina]|eukprot:KAF5843853.1 hypothetical protein DUNSADRAFT_5091 [Dunaliella salina]